MQKHPKIFLMLLIHRSSLKITERILDENECQIATMKEASLFPASLNLCQTH